MRSHSQNTNARFFEEQFDLFGRITSKQLFIKSTIHILKM